jgi:hypothetical protein
MCVFENKVTTIQRVARSSLVAKALCYKPEGRGLETL